MYTMLVCQYTVETANDGLSIFYIANKEQNTVESFHQSVKTYRNTQELGERLHTFIERAQSAGNAAVYSSTHRPNLDNSPPNAETLHSDIIMFPGSGIDIEDDSESSGTTAPNVSIEPRNLPCPGNASSFSVAQLVECDGEVYLFSEREASRTVEHGIHKLEHASVGKWKDVVKETRTGGRGLLLYPEYACVGFGAGKLCVFNTIEHTGKVYDIRNAGLVEPLPSTVKSKGGQMFHSLNPLSFTVEPDFQSTVVSPSPE